jgi:hypothetical protein
MTIQQDLMRCAVRLDKLKAPLLHRCHCGRVISANKQHCAYHAQEVRLKALGIVLPGGVTL